MRQAPTPTGRYAVSKMLPYLKIIAEQNGIQLNTIRGWRICCAILDRTIKLN